MAYIAMLLGGCAIAAQPQSSEYAPATIIAALIARSDVDLREQAECDPKGAEGYEAGKRWTLGDDMAHYLAEMSGGENSVTAECWPPEDGGRTCTVTFGQDKGELVWSRGYRFRMVDGAAVGDLMCFTIP